MTKTTTTVYAFAISHDEDAPTCAVVFGLDDAVAFATEAWYDDDTSDLEGMVRELGPEDSGELTLECTGQMVTVTTRTI